MSPQDYLPSLGRISLQAGVLVLLVLLAQGIFRRHLTARWRCALWLLVIVRLLLPFSPGSAASIFNLMPPWTNHASPSAPTTFLPQTIAPEALPVVVKPTLETPVVAAQPAQPSDSALALAATPERRQESLSPPKTSAAPTAVKLPPVTATSWLAMLFWVWFAGALLLTGYVATSSLRLAWRCRQLPALTDVSALAVLDECSRRLGVRGHLTVVECAEVASPALFGLFRPRLLLPQGFTRSFSTQELRFVFLHELAHLRRWDLPLNWLVAVLQILHWFNPLVWFGFARWRLDRELACDALAIEAAGADQHREYGRTILHLLENLTPRTAMPGLVGILENKRQLRRRIGMIANFRPGNRWGLPSVILLLVLALVGLTDAQPAKPQKPTATPLSPNSNAAKLPAASVAAQSHPPELTDTNAVGRPDLTGQVLAKGGAPLPVPATVFIATAAPKSGTSSFCPSCYLDCAKHTRTDKQGGFKIESLDPQLTFQVLAVAKGYQPKYVSKVDPAKGTPVTIELSPITASDAAPERSLRGRVVDPKGEPIEGAVVEMQGITTKDGGGSWGALSGIDPLAVTDENGEFLITAKKAFEMMSVKVTARTFANKVFNQLASGTPDHKLVMTEGATLTGRVLLAGQPLAGVSVGVSAVDRSAGTYLGHFEVGTGDRGNFTFVNLPPDADFHLYTLMETMAKFGAVPPRQIHTGKDGETTDAKDLMVGPAYRLAGRVELADGSLVPDKTRLLISREAAWDSMQLTLAPDGKFDVTGVPAETISLSVRLKGYHVSGRNLSVDQMNPFQLLGRVDQDRTNLVFLLEKGPDPQPDYSHIDPDYGASRSRPLRGAEGGPDHSREWTVSGRVLDGETQQPVENFRVTPGQTDQFNRTAWSALSAVDGSNGYYLTYVSKRAAQPLLKVEAEGYLPESLTVLPHDATNVVFVLKKGTGPAGTGVTPDGKPAAGATIVLLGDDFNQAGLNAAGELTAYWNKSALRTADADGHFSFKPIWGMKSVAAASSNGFAMVHLESLATNSTITLEPFGKITGTLKRASGPGTNEDLDLSFADPSARGLPRLNLTSHALTDGQGRFTFDRVPPASLRISYREVMTGANRGAWTSHPLKDLELKPGQTSEVNIETTDRPAPEAAPAYQQPQPKLIPGEQVQGVVLLPNGQPAALVEVALQVEGKYLGLGKGVFSSSGAREEGLLVSAGTDGSFTLPLYEKAQSVIALNEEGYAQVSLEQLTTTPQITLQKWGHIEGTLLVGHHVGTNERVVLSAAQPRWSSMSFRDAGHSTNQVTITNASPLSLPPPIYDFNVFQAKTDDQGRFVITFVPPGQQTIARMVSTGEGSWSQSQLAIVEVKPGETTVTNVGGTGRAVTGKVRIAEGAPPDFKGGFVSLITPTTKLMQQASQLKTDEERKAFYQSAAFQAATQERRIFTAALLPDGSFRADDVLPGEYVLSFRPRLQRMQNIMDNKFTSPQEFLVPEAKDKDDDSSVDWGEIELKEYTIPKPNPPADGK